MIPLIYDNEIAIPDATSRNHRIIVTINGQKLIDARAHTLAVQSLILGRDNETRIDLCLPVAQPGRVTQ